VTMDRIKTKRFPNLISSQDVRDRSSDMTIQNILSPSFFLRILYLALYRLSTKHIR